MRSVTGRRNQRLPTRPLCLLRCRRESPVSREGYRAGERYWLRMLRSRSWAGRRLTWEKYHQIKARTPLLKPKLRLPYAELQALAVL